MRVFPVVRGSFFGVLRGAEALLEEGQQLFQGDGKSGGSKACQPARDAKRVERGGGEAGDAGFVGNDGGVERRLE